MAHAAKAAAASNVVVEVALTSRSEERGAPAMTTIAAGRNGSSFLCVFHFCNGFHFHAKEKPDLGLYSNTTHSLI
jgi:hypothetical protein